LLDNDSRQANYELKNKFSAKIKNKTLDFEKCSGLSLNEVASKCLEENGNTTKSGFEKYVDFLPAYGEDSSLSALTFIPPVILQ
jgi:hypothetical protein